MSKAKHISRKELRHDAVQDAGRSFLEYLEDHRNRIITGLLVVLVVIVAVRGFTAWQRGRRNEVSTLLSDALRMYNQAGQTPDPVERDNLLNAAIDRCDTLQAEFGPSANVRDSIYIEASAYLLQDNYDRAIETFQELVESKAPDTQARGHLGMGYVYENRAFAEPSNPEWLEQARTHYEKARELAEPVEGGMSYRAADAAVALARIRMQQGDLEGAAELYRTVADKRAVADVDTEAPDIAEEDTTLGELSREGQITLMRREMHRVLTQFRYARTAQLRLDQIEPQIADAATSPTATP